jgi:hypothetical protein
MFDIIQTVRGLGNLLTPPTDAHAATINSFSIDAPDFVPLRCAAQHFLLAEKSC